ncbi:MAG: NHLP bacteriocin export ABC transporter permease/ATPase subunit [Clostridiales bacterium]|nr:NHLP bacteriocin export ABC transporter permease/ATPase subunit [Clostridiales bacterium]
MGWFDEQIKERKQSDDNAFSEAFVNIASAVMGKSITASMNNDSLRTKNAMDIILKYYRVTSQEIPDDIKDKNEQLEYLMRPNGIMRRTVNLTKGWYKNAIGAMLGILKSDGNVVALIPTGFSGYSYIDPATGEKIRINSKTQNNIDKEAIVFYKPFPLKRIGIKELMKYIISTLSILDYTLISVATLAVALFGLFLPKLNNIVLSDVVTNGNMRLFYSITVFLVCATISTLLITGVKTLITDRINTKLSVNVQAATIMRLFSLPADFFKNYSAGELAQRTNEVNALCNIFVSTILSTGLTALFSLIYIFQIFIYAPALVVPAFIVTLSSALTSLILTFLQMKSFRRRMKYAGEESGITFSLINGIQKIKLSGAEKRAFAKWGNLYAKLAEQLYFIPKTEKIITVINLIISFVCTIIMYFMAVKTSVSVADYYSFTCAFGMMTAAFELLTTMSIDISKILPTLERVRPILDTLPEISEGKRVVTRLSGSIEINNLSFKYTDNMPNVIDNLSLKIRPGQYIAIVGETGCGKSTLMRLLLGFEKAQKGAIYYDGQDINKMDLKSLRRKVGTVMQDGKLFQGDIYSNITISAPWATMDDAWEAAEKAGIAEDIRHMPMGMFTVISEGSGGVSGGQRQRLMIARAIAPKPRILMFDEATSALDNITQKKVSESLDSLKCTRIVIAHRLSTIKHCDRIIVLNKGKIIEDGSYDELIENNGFFAELVERQRLDANT